MKRFCFKLGLFFLPLAVVFLPMLYHLESFREIEAIETMVERNQNEGALIGLAYTDPMHLVKYGVLKGRQPEIVALGSSRVLPFRDFAFRDPGSFYNCGRSVGKLMDLKSFLSSYPGEKPNVIILGLDQDFFAFDDSYLKKQPRSYVIQETTYGSRLIKGTKAFFDVIKEGKLVLSSSSTEVETSSGIGRNARLYSEGYRSDGSYRYGRLLRAISSKGDYSFRTTLRRIEKGEGRFTKADRIHPQAIDELAEFLKLCKQHGIHVVAFLPPYAHRVYQRLDEERSMFPQVFDLHATLLPVFRQYDYQVFDFSDLSSLGSNDYETYDGFHASEVAYLKLITEMAEEDSMLAAFLDQPKITALLKNPFSARQAIKEVDEKAPERPNIFEEGKGMGSGVD